MISSRTTALFAMALVVGLGVAVPVPGWTLSPPYAQMAPLAQYLIADRQTEIDLARSAAPAAISRQATVLVLTPHGYETAQQGTNGFTCLVERSWENPFDNSNFWNSKLHAPVCYNQAASRTVLPYTILRTEMALAGVSKTQMLDRLQAAISSGRLSPAAQGSMAYMMSHNQYLGDGAKSWYPHVMVYAPKSDSTNAGESWGADRQGSPVVFDASDHVNPEPWAVFYIPVASWSDGSSAPALAM
jgi:hypothetical protein